MSTPLEIAISQLRTASQPARSSAAFVSLCFEQSGEPLPNGFDFTDSAAGLIAARNADWLVSDPEPGDVVFLSSVGAAGGLALPDDVGFVVSVLPGGRLDVLSGAGPLSDRVGRLAWHPGQVVAYMRVPERGGPCWQNNLCPAGNK